MKIPKLAYIVIVFTLFFGTIELGIQMDWWNTSGKYTTTGEKVELSGENADDIKGWMTIKDVSDAFHIPVSEIYAQYKFPADLDPATAMKELEDMGENFSLPLLREWVKERKATSGS